MRVLTKKTEEEIRKELFGPIQEAARLPYQLNVDPRKSWCELSELRLTTLVCQFKPCGINKQFHLLAIVDHMGKIYDGENAQSEIFLSDENKEAFRNQQRDLQQGGRPERVAYPPKYMCRPSLEVVEKKLDEWFGMKFCEENESYPLAFSVVSDYTLPDYIMDEIRERDEIERQNSPVDPPPSNRKRRIRTSED